MKLAAYFAVLCVAAFAAALADEPPPPAAQPASVPAAAAQPAAGEAKPAVEAAAATPAKVEKAAPIDKAATEALIKTMRGRGYKPVNRNGTLVFCRSEGEIGTHFQRTRCNTIDELKQAELTGKEYVNSIQQQGSPTPFKGP
ncbi:MAG TPA: hypothetical protein VGD54_12845 [Steroidobacteraceae bacterium]